MQRWEARWSGACTRAGLLVLLCAPAIVGCGSAGARDQGTTDGIVVWEGSKDQWVRLESRDDAGSPPNDHPAQVSAAEISGALTSLQVVEDEEDAAEPIFTPQEASMLGEAVARGLAQAGPDQDVTFRSVGSRRLTSGKVLKGVSVNSGRLFQQAGKLNLIFGDVRARAKTKPIYGRWEEDFSKPRPAARSADAEHDWKVVAPAGVEQRDGRDDWLVFDPTELTALAVASAATQTAPASASNAAAPAPPAAPPPPVAPATQTAPAEAAPAAPASPEADMERRLRTLKDLRDKGLITEDAYRAKIEEILSVL